MTHFFLYHLQKGASGAQGMPSRPLGAQAMLDMACFAWYDDRHIRQSTGVAGTNVFAAAAGAFWY